MDEVAEPSARDRAAAAQSREREARLFQGRTQRTSCVQTPTPGNSGLHSVVVTEAGLRVVPRTAG